MSKVIDERVVEMRFDNKQFEAETKKTRDSLAKLKEALKFPGADDSLKKVDTTIKGMSFSGLQAGIDALTKRFSTFGIVGMRIIENVTDALMNKMAKAINFVTDSIVSGGIRRAMNIENAHFQLQALLKDEEKVQAVMDNAMESVDGTAYAYDEAAKAASMFAASGIQAGEEMLQALKGITGVAAMTNSDFQSMSMIFTTVAGNGRLMGDQLLQLSSRGLNAASTIADYFREVQGQANMTEETIREMVTKGQISFKTFSDAMTWAFGDSAKRANETFTGAMSNMKSALARIGAGFISPLVEQNGEMVNLFNALRIKINDVKSALVFDEQTSAVSGLTKETRLMADTVADMVANGSLTFTDFTQAINGTGKSEERLAQINETLATTFNRIKEEGTVGTETLHEFGRTGVEATTIVREYMNGVMNGTIKASKTMKESVNEITGGYQVMVGDVTKFAKEGKLSFDVFNSAIVHASGLAKEGTAQTSAAIKGLFSEVKKAGTVSVDALMKFSDNGMNAAKALKDYINGVTNGTIRASYATRSAIEEMTGGVELASGDIQKFANEGKISFAMFQSAMEESFGDSRALSKQFTDFFLDNMKKLVNAINTADVTKPMELFYYAIESVKNVAKGAITVLKPLGQAFSEVTNGFTIDNVIDMAAKLEELTAQFKISEKSSENLRKAFKGVFDVGKALIDIILRLVRAIIPSAEPVRELGSGFLGLAGSVGEALSKFAEWLNTSPKVQKAIDGIGTVVHGAVGFIKLFIDWVKNLVVEVYNMPLAQDIITSLGEAFEGFGDKLSAFFKSAKENVKLIPRFFKDLFSFGKSKDMENVVKGFENVKKVTDGLDFEKPITAFDKIKRAALDLGGILMGKEGFAAFAQNANDYFKRFSSAPGLDVSGLKSKLQGIIDAFNMFLEWIKENLKPMFTDVTFGGVVSAGTGIGMIYAMIKMAKSFDSFANKLRAIPDILGPIKSTLSAYQKDLKANQLLKIAGAIGILALALTVLSWADFDQMMNAAIALGLVAAAIMWAAGKMLSAVNRVHTLEDALFQAAKGIKKALRRFGDALIIKSLGSAIKDVGKAVMYISLSIGALAILGKTNPQGLDKALNIVEYLGIVLGGVFATIVAVAMKLPDKNMSGMLKITGSVIVLSIALGIVVSSLRKLLSMELPDDTNTKLGLLVVVFLTLVGLMSAIAIVGQYTNGAEKASGAIIAVAGSLLIVVLALSQLFKMNIPEDLGTRLLLLIGVLVVMGTVALALSKLAKSSGGTLKAGGTVLAMSVMLIALTWSLKELSDISGNKLLRAVLSLGAVLLALGSTFKGLGKVAGGKDVAKSVFNMAMMIGVITVALGVLSMVPLEQLVKGAATLGAILLTLALDFVAAGKCGNDGTWQTVLSMVFVVGAVTLALAILATQPWQGLLAGAVALGTVLVALAAAFKIISNTTVTFSLATGEMFVAMILMVIGIAWQLRLLAEYPWDGLLAAAGSISLVLLAYAAAFRIISETAVKEKNILPQIALLGTFVIAIWALIEPMQYLADYPWQNVIASGTAISEVLLAISAGALIVSKIKTNVKSGLAALVFLDAFIIDLTAILVGFGLIEKVCAENGIDLNGLLKSGTGTLALIANGIGEFVGNLIGGFSAGVMTGLGKIGQGLSDFMNNAGDFWDKLGMIDESATQGMKNLAEAVIIITANDVLQGMTAFITKGQSMERFGEELKAFGPALKKFATSVEGIDSKQVEGAANAALLMAKVAESMPAVGGLEVLIFGANKSLTQMATELKDFGPALSEFATTVEGVTESQVTGAANAAGVLAEMAKTMPRVDGWAQVVFGTTKSLSDFGTELTTFGPNLAQFAEDVKDITQDKVDGAANAATILADMAKNMPETDSLWEKWFGGGETSITQFSADLITFGENMVSFAEKVKGFSNLDIVKAATGFKYLVDLGGYIGDKTADPIVDFSNDMTYMAEDGIETFVEQFENSSEKVKGAITTMVGYVTTAVSESGPTIKMSAAVLGVLMATAIKDSIVDHKNTAVQAVQEYVKAMISAYQDTFKPQVMSSHTQNGLNGVLTGIATKKPTILANIKTLTANMISQYRTNLPASTFATITATALQGVSNGINNKKSTILNTMGTLCAAIVAKAKTGLTSDIFSGIGSNAIYYIAVGMALQTKTVTDAATNVANSFITAMKNALAPSTFSAMGSSIMGSFIEGVNSQKDAAVNAAKEVANAVNNTLQNEVNTNVGTEIGQNISQGVADGIKKNTKKVENQSKNMAKVPKNTTQKLLQIKSPSRIMEKLATYVPEGFAIGIKKGISRVVSATSDMTDSVVSAAEPMYNISKSIMEYIDLDDMEVHPTITPVINMSDVNENVENINDMLNGVRNVQVKFNEAIQTPTLEARNISSNFLSPAAQNRLRQEEFMNAMIPSTSEDSDENGPRYPITNNFYIQGDDPKAIADEVSRVIQQQVERKERVWA